jgi:hydroxymethylglutaryl-CoA lyase
MPDVRVVEVGARDGLQNEKQIVPTATKVELIDRLSTSGLSAVEVTSFVSPKWIPQLADAREVLDGIARVSGTAYPVLVPNMRGFEAAMESGVDEIAVFTAASDAFNQKNINCDIAESFVRLEPVVAAAKVRGLRVRGYVSCVLGCPEQGNVPVRDVVCVAEALDAMGCDEISLGDTIGVGTPARAREMVSACAESVPIGKLAVHFHDTYGQALANVLACLEVGVEVVDSSVGGLGGCPYAKGATGNLATEDLLYMLDGLGVSGDADLDRVIETAIWISSELDRRPESRLSRVRANG